MDWGLEVDLEWPVEEESLEASVEKHCRRVQPQAWFHMTAWGLVHVQILAEIDAKDIDVLAEPIRALDVRQIKDCIRQVVDLDAVEIVPGDHHDDSVIVATSADDQRVSRGSSC